MTTFPLGGFYRGKLIAPRVFSTTTEGGAASWVVPSGITEILAKCWGAGGGAGVANGSFAGGDGAAGGYAQARLTVTPGETLTIYVPTGGRGSNASVTPRAGGGGGSFAGVFRAAAALVLAPGGGGGGTARDGIGGRGGNGGGASGAAGANAGSGGGGGATQSAGGAGGSGSFANASPGAQWIGGISYGSSVLGGRNGAAAALGANAGNGGDSLYDANRSTGGGGGAGWYGGGGGGRGGESSSNVGGAGGGGGSSYTTGTEAVTTAGSGTAAPSQTDFSYIAARGFGGTPSASASVRDGQPGLVVIMV